jgi:ABC-2 type transport system permease protein
MTLHGVLLVTAQEFRVRLRTGRWRWLLGAWLLTLLLFTFLVDLALAHVDGPHGIPLFGTLMLFVLALVLVVSPALTAQSINGDRERGTLAALQVTRLTAAEIAIGKLLAGWGVGIVALALSLPCVLWAMAEGGVTILRAAAVLLVVALLIGVVCAICQALSALLARSITSALLSYVTVFALTIGTLIAFTLATVTVRDENGYPRADEVWWILAPNPFAVLADSAPKAPAPQGPSGSNYEQPDNDPLWLIGQSVRNTRRDPTRVDENRKPPPVWPVGLGFDLVLGAGAVLVTIRRLRTPARTLAKGARIA